MEFIKEIASSSCCLSHTVPICKYLALMGSPGMLLFPIDESCSPMNVGTSHLLPLSCKSLPAAVSVMYRTVMSHLQNCLSSKVGVEEQLCGAEQAFPKNIFSFVSLSVAVL